MKKTKVKIPAKLNLTLNVLGLEAGYHQIESLVCSISLYDTITVKSRSDGSIRLKCEGIPLDCPTTNNNAYITAEKLSKKYNLSGVDLLVRKGIPVGGGLGGSSADIAGVINACKKHFKFTDDLTEFASDLGSDCAYMLKGGYALLKGRGEKVEFLNLNKRLYFLIVACDKSVSARECYARFDALGKAGLNQTELAVDLLKKGDIKGLVSVINNDLELPACEIENKIALNLGALRAVSNGFMTGSGSATFAVFERKKQRDRAYKLLKYRFGKDLIKAHSV